MEAPRLRLAVAALLAGAAVAGCGGGTSSDNGVTDAQRVSAQTAPSSRSAAIALQDQIVSVVKSVSPAVVQIQTNAGLGSGVVYDTKGDIVTNAHVVGEAKSFVITLASGETHKGTLVGTFPAGDLAVVRMEGARPKPAAFADSSKVRVGEFALAIGNPLGLRSSVTDGIVSSLGRTVPEGNGVALPSAIQTSAAINPGNSGGALVDLSGQVIGIPTLAAIDPQLGGTQAPGIGFAIPSNTVKNIADQLIEHGRVVHSDRAYLGVRVATIVEGGVLVARVEPNGPAAKAGIRQGDIIVAVNGQPTPTTDVLASVLATLKPGKKVPVEIVRAGHKQKLTVELGQLPGS